MPDQGPPGGRAVAVARRSVYLAFITNGFDFASWASRIPQVRAELRLTPGALGLVLLCIAIGSAVATPASGMGLSPVRSWKVKTAATPGQARAASVRMTARRAWAWELRSTAAWRHPAGDMSSTNRPRPVR